MTHYEKSNLSFRCRTAGVIIHDRAIFLQGEPQGTFWTLPGGGIIDDLMKIALYPSFLPAALQKLPLAPEHVVFDERTLHDFYPEP